MGCPRTVLPHVVLTEPGSKALLKLASGSYMLHQVFLCNAVHFVHSGLQEDGKHFTWHALAHLIHSSAQFHTKQEQA
jgi:hypothetical protein